MIIREKHSHLLTPARSLSFPQFSTLKTNTHVIRRFWWPLAAPLSSLPENLECAERILEERGQQLKPLFSWMVVAQVHFSQTRVRPEHRGQSNTAVLSELTPSQAANSQQIQTVRVGEANWPRVTLQHKV